MYYDLVVYMCLLNEAGTETCDERTVVQGFQYTDECARYLDKEFKIGGRAAYAYCRPRPTTKAEKE